MDRYNKIHSEIVHCFVLVLWVVVVTFCFYFSIIHVIFVYDWRQTIKSKQCHILITKQHIKIHHTKSILHSNHTKIICRQSRNAIYLRAFFTYLLDRRKTIFTMSFKYKKNILWFVYAYLWFLTTVNINFIAVQFLWSFSVVCLFFFLFATRDRNEYNM